MSLISTITTGIATTEILTGDDLVANSQLLHTGYDTTTGALDDTTTPDVTAAAFQTIALVAGAKTIDLTALLLNGAAVSFSGLQPRAIRITNLGAADMTFAKGASNGYTGLGANFSVTLKVGQTMMFALSSNGVVVGGSDKTIDVTGTGTDTFRLSAVAGT